MGHLRQVLLLGWIWLLSLSASAQPRLVLGEQTPLPSLRSARVSGGVAGEVQIYLRQAPSKAPLLIVLQGSGLRPLVEPGERRFRSCLLFTDLLFDKSSPPYHLVFVERRGVQSFRPGVGRPSLSDSLGGLHKSIRVSEVCDVVHALAAQSWVEEVVLVGHSEGVDVAAAVSRQLPGQIAALGLFAGPGPSRFFDFLMEARQASNSQAVVEILQEEIALAGRTEPGTVRGAPYQYEKSYAIESTSLEDLLTHRLPLYVVQGGRDRQVSPISGDLSAVELFRDPSRPMHYLVCPDLDHGLADASGEGHEMELWRDFCNWLTQQRQERRARLWRPE